MRVSTESCMLKTLANSTFTTHNSCEKIQTAEFMTNLTLTVDETLLRKARILALERGTSVNALVREFIENMVNESMRRSERVAA